MAATWQERMAVRAHTAAFNAALGGAHGWCTDEGDESRPTVFEYSRLDALTVARSGYLGEYAKEHANSRDIKKQKEVADFLASPEHARSSGVIVKVDVTERQLAKAEFFARREAGIANIQTQTGLDKDAAKYEWMRREAEAETGISRAEKNPARRNEYRKAYRKRCRKDW
jgi:hypothetical protein